jgi:hypothetical protein
VGHPESVSFAGSFSHLEYFFLFIALSLLYCVLTIYGVFLPTRGKQGAGLGAQEQWVSRVKGVYIGGSQDSFLFLLLHLGHDCAGSSHQFGGVKEQGSDGSWLGCKIKYKMLVI